MSYSNGATVGSVPAFSRHSFTVLDESSSTYLPFNISFCTFSFALKVMGMFTSERGRGLKRICFGGNIVRLPQLRVN